MSKACECQIELDTDQLMEIAKWRRFAISMVWAQILSLLLPRLLLFYARFAAEIPKWALAVQVGQWVLIGLSIILSIYGVYKLASSLSEPVFLYVPLVIVFPWASAIALICLSAVASRALRRNGSNTRIGTGTSGLDRIETASAGSDGSE